MRVRKMGHQAMIAGPSIQIHWRQEMRAREVLVPAAQGCQDPEAVAKSGIGGIRLSQAAQEVHVILIPGHKQLLGPTML